SLLGQPNATITHDGSRLTGPNLKLDPEDGTYKVTGPGTFHGIAKPEEPGDRPRIIDVEWQLEADVNMNTNVIRVSGDVAVRSSEEENQMDSARAERIVIELAEADEPATQPTTQPVTRPATQQVATATQPTTGP